MRRKETTIFNIELTFDRDAWNRDEMEAVKKDIIEGMSYADIIEKHDNFGMCDAAVVAFALDLGWNMKEYIDNEIMELLYNYFVYDGETTVSLDRLITTEALDYIEEHIAST